MTSPEVSRLPLGGVVAVVPLGEFEQHGPHLPLTTDTDIVTAIEGAAALPVDGTRNSSRAFSGHARYPSGSGVVGHPELATSEKEQRFFEASVKDTLDFVNDFAGWS